jgi:erythromycin esterase-like protein
VLGLRDGEDQSVKEWFGAGFGALHANHELVEWMRQYNGDPAHPVKLHLYGFDLRLGQGGLASPSRVLESCSTGRERAGAVPVTDRQPGLNPVT